MPNTPNRKLYVGNLPYSLSHDELRNLFCTLGPLEDCHIMKEPSDPRKSRGYGFVIFRAIEHAEAAVRSLNGHQMGSESERRAIQVQYADTSREPQKRA
ncbi:RNA-binding domain-containing protein [Atractiella rhizophila]|nr:RNA-binding domain-containing protein [Atractiella rhizophila]